MCQDESLANIENTLALLKSLGVLTIVVSSNGAVFLSISPNLVKTNESIDSVLKSLDDARLEILNMKT